MAIRSRWPACSAASRIASIAISLDSRSGAKPPSSPTPVESPRSSSSFFSSWYVSAAIRSASAKLSAPAGTTMNSCRSIELSACTPPLITFSIGTGSVVASSPPRWRKSETPESAAAAFATASETPRTAFAPSRLLFGVPSSSIRRRSTAAWSAASRPATAAAISPLTFATAVETPFPFHVLPPSRSSTASCTPVEAPDGTIALPSAPATTSTSTVGFPRESRTCRACTLVIALTRAPLPGRSTRPARRAAARSNSRRSPQRAPRPPRPGGGSAVPRAAARARDRPRACGRR